MNEEKVEQHILLLGNPLLRTNAAKITAFDGDEVKNEIARVKEALDQFRKEKGFGRGLAGPQIGISKQIIAVNFGEQTCAVINPEIVFESRQKFTMWDDCMSLPDLLVRVERNRSISMEYEDELGEKHEWKNIGQVESELLQHEIDHLCGILAIDRAIGKESIMYRHEFELNRVYFEKMVDYVIKPTI